MVQVQRTTTGMSTGDLSASITSLANSITTGGIIRGSHLATLQNIYNLFESHTHEAFDQHFIKFGNVGGGSTTSSTKVSSTPVSKSPSSIATTGLVDSSPLNILINLVNDMRTHTHTITDQTTY